MEVFTDMQRKGDTVCSKKKLHSKMFTNRIHFLLDFLNSLEPHNLTGVNS